MANIELPKRFEDKVISQHLDGILKTTLSNFGEILKRTELDFFRDYTGHSKEHIESVLASSNNLITNETFNTILSENDVVYYTLSVILHDIGMHLNLDGFKRLVSGEYDNIRVTNLDSSTWKELWEEYLTEAKRFSGKQLIKIFGTDSIEFKIPAFSNESKTDPIDEKLIGEFLRRHHARLAHEIALKGFPANNIIPFGEGLDDNARNIIGLIARSHGIPLRKCIDNIEYTYGRNSRRVPLGIHAPYLMVLLRLADYIQIDNSRTSKVLLTIKKILSPFSKLEHFAHLAIDHIDDKYQDDPERIYVSASPKDSMMHLKLTRLMNDIQKEFDTSWAVLGEVYGMINSKPDIKYRRITSNLDEKEFISKQQYVADNFAFKANDEITKLLIAPLYGDNPSYGVRELLQNAIDACREREKIERKNGESYSGEITVDVTEEDEKFYLAIKDNGIGMDIEVIKNYFLSAGASFRKSLEWQKEFVDEVGNSVIRRSGRFGVGVLAGFLIGKDINVKTKRKETTGFIFNADLNSEQINILKDENIDIGTSIKIEISQETLDRLNPRIDGNHRSSGINWYKWFTLDNPIVKYSFLGKEQKSYEVLNPDYPSQLPNEWNEIDSLGFNKIFWTYSDKFANVSFSCNGIVVNNYPTSDKLNLGLMANKPKISVFDNNAFLPLSLDRNSFSRRLPFDLDLLKDVYKDFIATILVANNINTITDDLINLHNIQKIKYPGCNHYEIHELYYGNQLYSGGHYNPINEILISKEGFILNYNYFLKKLGKVNVILIQSEHFYSKYKTFELDLKDHFLHITRTKMGAIQDYVRAIEGLSQLIQNARIFMKKSRYDYIFSPEIRRTTLWLKDKCSNAHVHNNWTYFDLDNAPPSIISDSFLDKNSDTINFMRQYVIDCKSEGDSLLNELLSKYFGEDVIIPFDIQERKDKFPLAFSELKPYMDKHIAIQGKASKKDNLPF